MSEFSQGDRMIPNTLSSLAEELPRPPENCVSTQVAESIRENTVANRVNIFSVSAGLCRESAITGYIRALVDVFINPDLHIEGECSDRAIAMAVMAENAQQFRSPRNVSWSDLPPLVIGSGAPVTTLWPAPSLIWHVTKAIL